LLQAVERAFIEYII